MTTLKKIAAAVCAAACIASVSAAPDDISKLNPYVWCTREPLKQTRRVKSISIR